MKPCLHAIGGEQFKMPQQYTQMLTFYSWLYLALQLGSLTAKLVTPILRQDILCFGDDDCYALAFGIPGVLTLITFGRNLTLQL